MNAVSGRTPAATIRNVVPVLPGDLPDELKAGIVNPHDFKNIPLLDFSLLETPEGEAMILEQLQVASMEVGFFSVVNHSVPTELMEKMLGASRRFFALPTEVKNEYLMKTATGPLAGYFSKGMENMDDVVHGAGGADENVDTAPVQRKVDCKEGFDMQGGCGGDKSCPDTTADGTGAAPSAEPSAAPSGAYRWTAHCEMPDEHIEDFSLVMREYQEHCMQLGLQIMTLISKLMGENGHLVRSSCDNAVCHHRILHYPPLTDYHTEVSIGAHVDYGFLTLLVQDMVGGLQVLNNKRQQWIHVPPIQNAFVVNFGAMLQLWTRNRIKATVHRVVNLSTRERYSSPYFFRPSLDTILDPAVFDGSSVASTNTSEEGNALSCEEVLSSFYKRTNLL